MSKDYSEISFNADNAPSKLILEQKKMGLGYLGSIFGDKESAPTNIIGLWGFLFTVGFIVAMFVIAWCSPSILIDFIKTVASIIGIPVGLLLKRSK